MAHRRTPCINPVVLWMVHQVIMDGMIRHPNLERVVFALMCSWQWGGSGMMGRVFGVLKYVFAISTMAKIICTLQMVAKSDIHIIFSRMTMFLLVHHYCLLIGLILIGIEDLSILRYF